MSRHIPTTILALALASSLTSPATAGADQAHAVVAVYNRYLPSTDLNDPTNARIEIHQGDGLLFANVDVTGLFFFIPDHTITEFVDDGISSPRFDSGAVAVGDTRPVVGVETLGVGEYRFYCLTHGEGMRGTLVVLA